MVLNLQIGIVELSRLNSLHEFLLVLLRDDLLDKIDHSLNIAPIEESFDEALGIEFLKVREMLSGSNEDDWGVGRGHCREGSSSLGMTVQFGHDNRAYFDGVFEGQGLVVAGGADGGVHDENALIWIDSFFDGFHLVEEGALLFVSS